MVEKRDAVLRAGKHRRLAALGRLKWSIQRLPDELLPQGVSPDLAREQQDFLRHAYDRIDNLQQAILWMGMAEFRGFAHLEKWRDGHGACHHLEPVPQRHWVREGLNGAWEYNAQSTSGINRGEAIRRDDFIIREVEDPIDEIAAISFLRRNLAQKDWDGFVETYGIPSLFVEMPPHVPMEQRSEYQAVAEGVVNNARGVLPAGATVKVITSQGAGTNPFQEHIAYQDQLVVLAMTGGKLSMLNESTGIGGSQARVHQDAFDALAQAEALEISEVFQAQFDAVLLSKHFHKASPVPLAYFQIAADKGEEVGEVISHATELDKVGLKIDPSELSERTGYQLQSINSQQGDKRESIQDS